MDHTIDALVYATQLKGAFMGCDIHWHSETKNSDGAWLCDQAASFAIETEDDGSTYINLDDFPGRDRDYWMFGLLQPGVRSTWPWSFPEREVIPDDLSTEVQQRIDHYDTDGHSHGYVTRAELKAKREELRVLRAEHLIDPNAQHSEALHHHIKCVDDILADLGPDGNDEDRRIVFFFDN